MQPRTLPGRRLLGLIAGVGLLAGCAAQASDTPIDSANQVTRAVYNDDLNGTVAQFDDGLRDQVTAQEVDQLSQVMRGLGPLEKMTTVNADPLNRRYDYRAAFDRGAILVQVRFDPDGRIAAYRATPIEQ